MAGICRQSLVLLAAGATLAGAATAQELAQGNNVTATEEGRVRWSVEQAGMGKKDLVLRGNLLLAGNDLAKALMAFDKALELDGDDSAALTGRAIVLARQGKFDEAERLLRQQCR
jgi:Tfp pilus assembly protein PilF